jgi:excisionase family DNA binding protein
MERRCGHREPLVLTVPEAATELRLSRATVYRLIKEDGLPAIQLRGKLRVPYRALQQWVEDRTERHSGSAAAIAEAAAVV